MQIAHIVTDLGFGDSGKGATVDRLAAASAKYYSNVVVIRHTGGSQAGHTVDLRGGKRHIHASFASGALGGFPSHMSSYCPIYPQNLIREAEVLQKFHKQPLESLCSVDPLTPMITVYDVAWNRAQRSIHGITDTCGIGVGATMERLRDGWCPTFIQDLTHPEVLKAKLKAVCEYYHLKIKCQGWSDFEYQFDRALEDEKMDPTNALLHVDLIPTGSIVKCADVVIFEGAQGVMLDQDHGILPYTTWGHTTCRNAVEMINQYGFDGPGHVHVHAVTRAYQTRHGHGPMTSEEPIEVPADPTNITNPYQGEFRTGTLDFDLLRYARDVERAHQGRLEKWLGTVTTHVTCCDHLSPEELTRVTKLFTEPREWGTVKLWSGPHRDSVHTEL